MTIPERAPTPPVTARERLEARLRRIFRGPDAEKAIRLILADADAHAAQMIELYARPDDRWGPE